MKEEFVLSFFAYISYADYDVMPYLSVKRFSKLSF